MTSQFINRLPISNVTQKTASEDQINIMFSIEGRKFFIPVTAKQDEFFRPAAVVHEPDNCPYCPNAKSRIHCRLEDFMDELFYRLIDQPSIRLEWLFIPHK